MKKHLLIRSLLIDSLNAIEMLNWEEYSGNEESEWYDSLESGNIEFWYDPDDRLGTINMRIDGDLYRIKILKARE